ncbi:MAG: WecB/TagA/CpsF family glycosyltransferase [Candidatus Methylacidiphilales bacterium]
MKHLPVLGTPVAVATYETGFQAVLRLAASGRARSVCASNTHIISQARHDCSFGAVIRGFDMVLPDGMPLVWSLNRRGAALNDRVYGPYFMRYVLQHSPPGMKHFFFGGKAETLEALTAEACRLNSALSVAGVYSPPFRKWDEADEVENARVIRESGADVVWVALGGERQERWIASNLHRHERGVFIAVGDAFELLAGRRPFAPDWIQKRGLTWLYRLYQEPRRLWPRYFKYNSLFLMYEIKERMGFSERKIDRPVSVAFVGSRGVPACYSGFETVVEELGKRLVRRGYAVTVYNRRASYDQTFSEHEGMRIRWYPTVRSKSLETPVHTFLCLMDTLWRGYDILYVCGVGNAPLTRFLSWVAGVKLMINVDGADYRRAKWGPVGRFWLKRSELEAVRVAHCVIADNLEIANRYETSYGCRPRLVSYGIPEYGEEPPSGILQEWDLKKDEYFLFVGRITPENAAHLAIEGYLEFIQREEGNHTKPLPRLVILGDAGYELDYWNHLHKLAEPAGAAVVFAGARYGAPYRELSRQAIAFLLPSQIEATRLVLLDQMGMGSCIIYRDCAATRHVIGDAGVSFDQNETAEDRDSRILGSEHDSALLGQAKKLAQCLQRAWHEPEWRQQKRDAAHAHARKHYSWDAVADTYEEIFQDLLTPAMVRKCKGSEEARR